MPRAAERWTSGKDGTAPERTWPAATRKRQQFGFAQEPLLDANFSPSMGEVAPFLSLASLESLQGWGQPPVKRRIHNIAEEIGLAANRLGEPPALNFRNLLSRFPSLYSHRDVDSQ